MIKNRIEAFSDGVFAIAITLLVLDIRLPEGEISSDGQLFGRLLATGGSILTFVFSFLVTGIFWIAHHRIFDLVKQVNHRLMWSNVCYLMTVALIPFPASVLAHHPVFKTAIIFYSAVLLLCGLQHMVLMGYIYRKKELQAAPITARQFRLLMLIAGVGPGCYALAIGVCLINPLLAFLPIMGATVFYIFLVPFFLPRQPET